LIQIFLANPLFQPLLSHFLPRGKDTLARQYRQLRWEIHLHCGSVRELR